jgi:hypothetical protein
VSTNLPLWGLSEAKRLLVIAIPLWDPQQRRSLLCGSELQIKSLVSLLVSVICNLLTLEACLCPIYILVVFLSIYVVAGGS